MFCNECGAKVPDGSKFCNECGFKFGDVKNQNGIELDLTCDACGGIMKLSKYEENITCPYCGATKVLSSSDEVKLKRIDASLREKEMNMEYDTMMFKNTDEYKKNERKDMLMLLLCAVVVTLLTIPIFVFLYFIK